MFIAIAHRGFSSQAPENTLAAFDLALASGFDNIELDVQLTSDKLPVVIHDATVDRTTDGEGEVASISQVQLRKLDAGSWLNAKYKSERIPTLEEVLRRYDGKVHLHLELKSNDPNLPEIVAKTLKDNGWLKYGEAKPFAVPGLTITSKYIEQLERSLKLLPDVPHHWLSWEINDEIIARVLKLGLQGICIAARYANPGLIAKAKKQRLTIRGLEVKGDEDIKVLFETGAEGATTNWPERVEKIINIPHREGSAHMLRVFTDTNGNYGDPASVVIDEGKHTPDPERQALARRLNTGETIFVNDLAAANISIVHPQGEIGFAGVGVLGAAWLLAKLRSKPTTEMYARDGKITVWQEDDITWARANLSIMPPWNYKQLESADAVEHIKLEDMTQVEYTMLWAWVDESKGLIRARTFASDWDIPEAEGNGSGAMVLATRLNREIEIRHGKGSVIFARPAAHDCADIGGRVKELENN